GTIGVVVREGPPVFVVVLGNPPGVGPGLHVDQVLGDRGGPGVPDRTAGDVARGQVRLDRVHIAVGAAVRLGFGEGGVPALPREAFRVGPEMPVDGGRGVGQDGIGAGNARGHRAGGGQQDVGMGVVRLGGVEDVPGGVQAGEPASVLAVGI